MPLHFPALTTDPGLPGAKERAFPNTLADAAAQWAAAVGAYFAAVAPPSSAVAAAQQALQGALLSAFVDHQSTDNADAAMDLLEAHFASFALTVAAGMVAPPVTAAAPPPGLVGFRQLLQKPWPTTRAAGVAKVAALIDAWAKTGTATLAGSPPPVVPWS